ALAEVRSVARTTATAVAVAAGTTGASRLALLRRRPARGQGVPGEGDAAEAVAEAVAMGLAGRLVQHEGVQRLAVVGELRHAVVLAVDLAERAGEVARGRQRGAGLDRDPEAQAASGALDRAVELLLRRVDGLAGPVDQHRAEIGHVAAGER